MNEPVAPLSWSTVKIETPFGSITLTLDSSVESYNAADVAGALLRPALLAQGYDQRVVDKYVPEVY
jgi:hypothetical protein